MATNIPPHNVGELCDGLLHLIKYPNTGFEKIMEFISGPDFPTGGILSEDKKTIVQTYATGRGSMRIRAKWEKEELGKGSWQIVITEIPYQVQKSRLIEKIAEIRMQQTESRRYVYFTGSDSEIPGEESRFSRFENALLENSFTDIWRK